MVAKYRRTCWIKGAGPPTRVALRRRGRDTRDGGWDASWDMRVAAPGRPTRLMASHSRRLEGIKVQGEILSLGGDVRQADGHGPGTSLQRRGRSRSTQRHRRRGARVWPARVLRGQSPMPPDDGVECGYVLGQR